MMTVITTTDLQELMMNVITIAETASEEV